ncbi:MAG: ParB/RepB/Spo0J family partition protein [Fibrobacter sp.]|nr:ParB/RepB/Spo0J family partition protein [Fibrobacter sp.]
MSKNSRPWMNSDLAVLRAGRQPTGRTYRACLMFCRRHCIPFPGKKSFEENKELEKKFTQPQGIIMTKPQPKKTTPASANGAKTAAKAKAAPDAVKATKQDSTKSEERSYSFRTIDVDKILGNGDNVREVNDIEDLVSSIQAHGIINPITVTQDVGMATYYRVIAGFRRLAAAKQLKLKKVPCHVVSKDAEGFDEIPLSENVSRMGMTPYEECIAVKSLSNKKKTPGVIAKHFGRTLRWVLVRKKLADAGDKVLKKVKEGVIELSQAAKIADLPDNVFKRELEGCYRTDKYFIDLVLERYHKDLSKAPFEHEACLQCEKCSACQADLFENEPKAYCLDPACWARKAKKAAEAKVKKLQEEGRNARLGKFSGKCISYSDEADKYDINSWDTKGQEKAKEAGIQKRILVDAATGKTLEYYDKRDLPDYHEETEEEREAEVEKERKDRQFRSTKEDMTKSRIRKAIKAKIEKDGDKDDIIALLLFCVYDLDDTIHESQFDVLGIKKNIDECIGFSDIDNQVRPCDIHDAILGSVEHILGRMYDIDTLRKMYSIITYGNPKDAEPVDDEVEDEIKRIHEKKNEENNEDSNEDSENKEVDNE